MSEEQGGFDIQDASTVTKAVGELIRVAGDSKEAKEAGSEIGKTAVTLAKALNNCLIPLAAVNFAFDKARVYFQGDFQEDLRRVTKRIPPEALIEPRSSLAGPAIQGIAFTHEEPPLKQMYLELLSNSMDERHAGDAHPAFVEIIRQLTALEAEQLKKVLTSETAPIAKIKEIHAAGGSRVLYNHLLAWGDDDNTPVKEPRLPSMVVNWMRLGLIDVDYTRWIASDEAYEWAEARPELKELRDANSREGVTVQIQRGIMSVTPFGMYFAKATGLLEADPEAAGIA